jgi:hypothetical protein
VTDGRRSSRRIYDGQLPRLGSLRSTRAVTHGQHLTQADRLLTVHPVAHALADEVASFAWLLRHEAFRRFGFDPDAVFGKR